MPSVEDEFGRGYKAAKPGVAPIFELKGAASSLDLGFSCAKRLCGNIRGRESPGDFD